MNERSQGGMPQPHAKQCSFCERPQGTVPLLVMSPVTNSTICSYCAISIVEQTMKHMVNVSAAYKQVVQNKPEWFVQNPETGAITMIDPETAMDDLLKTANEEDDDVTIN